ncbi:MAG TPA: efflux RND transporter periplasmic adaptor subunit [Bryobacteraceae bacterium]|nr:efflux RND transporter periplasmic adaptor subunit [Bryobacteraceae bacterium]
MTFKVVFLSIAAAAVLVLSGCGEKGNASPAAEVPPPAKVIEQQDANVLQVGNPERFSLATAAEFHETPALNVNGSIAADVSRTVPVVSLVSGRVIELCAHLGDQVHKGQLLLRIQSNDVASAFNDYQNAVADEQLAKAQLDRSKTLYDKGATARKDLEVAEDAETKATVVLNTAREHLRTIGASLDEPTPIVSIYAPASGVITEQNVTDASGVKTLDNSPNLFTIADLSRVWVLCDVYENDLSAVHLGDIADIRLNAYPDKVFHARVSNIGQVLDPNTRTAKVRLDLVNPGIMKAGMFVTATFYGRRGEAVALVPATAILHLHDRDWVYLPDPGGKFRRTPVTSGNTEPGGMQIVAAGLKPGQQVVRDALQLTTEAQQ